MTTITFTTRGIETTVDTAALPASIMDKLIEYGVRQKVADSAASALAVAYDRAHPDHGLDGNELKDARRAWGATDEGKEAVNAVAREMIDAAVTALQNGEWADRVAGSAETFTMTEEALYGVASAAVVRKSFAKLDAAFRAGSNTSERKRLVLDAARNLSKAEASRFTKETGFPLSM